MYDQIISQVIDESRELFSNEGFDTNVLAELKKLWKEKLMASGAVNMGHGGMGGSGAAAGRAPMAAGGAGGGVGFGSVAMYPGVPSAQWNGQPPASLPGMMAPYAGGAGIRVKSEHALGQTDGAEHEDDAGASEASAKPRRPRRGDIVTLTMEMPREGEEGGAVLSIEQVDGAGGGPHKRRKTEDGEDFDDDDLGDDDDPGDDSELGSDDDESDEEPDTSNLVLCQYDKVARTKTKWKAQLKDGMMQANGQDFVFKKANGDMNFSK